MNFFYTLSSFFSNYINSNGTNNGNSPIMFLDILYNKQIHTLALKIYIYFAIVYYFKLWGSYVMCGSYIWSFKECQFIKVNF